MIQFLRRLTTLWRECSPHKNVNSDIVDEEQIGRFIFSKNHFTSSTKSVKYAAFIPRITSDESSVYRISTLTNQEKWNIGDKYVASARDKPILADAILKVEFVRNVSISGADDPLRVVSEKSPHPLHANITNWPKEKPQRKLAAIELANEAELNIVNK